MMNRFSTSSLSSSTTSSSDCYTQGSTEMQPPLFKLVKRLRWRKLSEVLKRNNHSCKERDETGLSLLGVSLGYHAPLEIIEQILSIDPSQLNSMDMFGANALHIACLNGNPHEVISFLLERDPSLASSRDRDNRTPLHQITECICQDEIHLSMGIEVIKVLYKYNCTMIHASDDNNNCPLDIVHVARCAKNASDAQLQRLDKATRFLRKLSSRFYRLKKNAWENKTIFDPKMFNASKSLFTNSTSSKNSSYLDDKSQGDTMGRFLEAGEDGWS